MTGDRSTGTGPGRAGPRSGDPLQRWCRRAARASPGCFRQRPTLPPAGLAGAASPPTRTPQAGRPVADLLPVQALVCRNCGGSSSSRPAAGAIATSAALPRPGGGLAAPSESRTTSPVGSGGPSCRVVSYGTKPAHWYRRMARGSSPAPTLVHTRSGSKSQAASTARPRNHFPRWRPRNSAATRGGPGTPPGPAPVQLEEPGRRPAQVEHEHIAVGVQQLLGHLVVRPARRVLPAFRHPGAQVAVEGTAGSSRRSSMPPRCGPRVCSRGCSRISR